MQGYKGFRQIAQQAARRLKHLKSQYDMERLKEHTAAEREHLFSEVKELPRNSIDVRPETFQGRDTRYSEETVEKIVREGFDKSREPIVVWKAPDGKYIVISGHSRWEASERLYKAGDKSLAKMPVKVFLGDLDDATDYALLESNREVTQEGLKSDLKAYRRAKERGYNREHLKGIFKPESRLKLLEDISYLSDEGSFLAFLGTEAEKSLPYLQRNAQWVGTIRKEVPALNNGHEEELFRYLYGLSSDSREAGKKKITITKDQFFALVNAKVSRIDFDPEQALNLDEHVSTSALTDPAKLEIQTIRAGIDQLIREREKKDELIARATIEDRNDLVETFRARQSDINQLITRKLLEIQKIEQQIGQLERSALDLFSQANDESQAIHPTADANRKTTAHVYHMKKPSLNIARQRDATEIDMIALAEQEPDVELAKEEFEIQHMLPESTIDEPRYAWDITQRDYLTFKSELRTGLPYHISESDRMEHAQIVQQALAYGYDVPDDVLADYVDLDKSTMRTVELSEIESETSEQNADNLVLGDQWFKEHPEKVLGRVKETTNRYNRPVTIVQGNLEDALKGINVPSLAGESNEVGPLEPEIKEPLQNLLADPVKTQKMNKVIAQTLKDHADKAVGRLKGEKDKFADGCPEEYHCFEEIAQTYNTGISEDEIKAWIWYQRQHAGLSDERTILNKANGWSRYVVPLHDIPRHLDTWLKTGVICVYKGDFLPSVLYYAENIYERLKRLNEDKQEIIRRFGKDQFERQRAGLENVQPAPLTLTDPNIRQRLFIKPDSVFAKDISVGGLADGTEINLLPTTDSIGLIEAFKTWLNARPKDEFKKTTNHNIITYYLEKKNPPRYHDEEERLRVKQNAKKEGDAFFVRFLAEALLPRDQQTIEESWNRTYNGYVEVNYMKVPVGFTCSSTFKNKPLFIRPAQREGIGFLSVHGSGCIAYDVGVGKTMTAILALAQALEMGQCKRPFIVVPNATYTNWMAELRGKVENGKVVLTGLLPQYPVNDLYNLSEDHLDLVRGYKGVIQAVPEKSISLLTYEGFNRLCFKDETWEKIGDELFDILNQGTEEARDAEKLREKIKELMGKGSRGGVAYIEDLELDYMVVDEAHAMKKSFTRAKGEVKDLKRQKPGYDLSSGEPSMTALRGFMISQYILRNNHMRNVNLLTATPFTNSPLEIYSILALIAYQQLTAWGIRNIKDFFDTFIRTSIELTINAKLQPERKEVVLGFNNLIALQQLIFKFVSYKSGEDALIQRPNKIVLPLLNRMVEGELEALPTEKQISTNLPMTTEQKRIMAGIESFITGGSDFDDLCNTTGFEEESNAETVKGTALRESSMSDDEKEGARVLRGLSFARQVALSPYLFACYSGKSPTYKEYIEGSPKLRYTMQCIRSVKDYHEQRGEAVSGQVIYMNAGVHFFPLIKDYLVKVIGYEESEVGIISSSVSSAKKEGIKERYQAGSIKIIIGSATIKEGINLQNRSTVLYNCWLDWNPTDVKQLEGRVWRFGNMFANVRIVNPLVEDSIDMFIFQKLEEKTSRINEIWYRAGRQNALDLEDFNPSELKMGLVTNPKILAELMLVNEKEEMQDDITRLNNEKSLITNIHNAVKEFNANIGYIRDRADRYRPPRAGAQPRAASTILGIFSEYLDDPEQKATDKDDRTYWKVYRAYQKTTRGLEETLAPRGLDLDFNEKSVLGKIDREVEALKKKMEVDVGKEAIASKEEQIIRDRKRKGYQRKSVDERVQEFSRMNESLLSELMVYDASDEGLAKRQQQDQLGHDLESSSDALEEMEALVKHMEDMEQILAEMQRLQAN